MGSYVVPEGMLKAVSAAYDEFKYSEAFALTERIRLALCKAVLRWQSENPRIPTTGWLDEFNRAGEIKPFKDFRGEMIAEWQRQMYLAPESEVPEEIKDLLRPEGVLFPHDNRKILEAYRRGKGSK